MILILNKKVTKNEAESLIKRLEFMGFQAVCLQVERGFSIALIKGVDQKTDMKLFSVLPEVEEIKPINNQFKLAGRDFYLNKTIVDINGVKIGGSALTIIAGPCAVESENQIFETAKLVAEGGATILRGGTFKPRTSPYDFQGLGEEGLRYLHDAGKAYNLRTISEVMAIQQIDVVAEYADILQIGARNMQNFDLLKAVGKIKKPVLLKRGLSATYKDLLMAAEYILSAGNAEVILCERGIRTFETYTRNTLDITAVPVLKELSHLPIIVDPSHGTGKRNLILPMARAAVAAGADGVMVEVHPDPDKALSDAVQTINPQAFANMVVSLNAIACVLEPYSVI
ncbi:Phospho-2-dehydro-3-deoxyheptonate aldolase [Gammaproteobacteria bacterium]